MKQGLQSWLKVLLSSLEAGIKEGKQIIASAEQAEQNKEEDEKPDTGKGPKQS